MDCYLAKTGYEGQQTEEPEDPERRDNLWEPVPGDHGAHGRFDAQAWDVSPQLWAATHRWMAWAVLAVFGVGIGALLNKVFSDN